jgi:hypothetical protein
VGRPDGDREPLVGYTRIQGALANLDHHVSRGTIANILRQRGIEPAPERQKRTTWKKFLSTHRGVLAAADFFTVEVWTAGGLTRFAVLFVIHLATRRVEIAGILPEPDSAWVIQCGRQLTDPVDGCLRGKRFLLHDRDPRFTDAFGDTLAAAGVGGELPIVPQRRLNEPVMAVSQPCPNPASRPKFHLQTMTRVAFNRSTLARYGLNPSRRRARLMPRSASDTAHDSGAASDSC